MTATRSGTTARPAALVVLLALAWPCGCAGTASSARDVKLGGTQREAGALSQAELQQDLQRFASQFMDNVVQAAYPLNEVQDPKVRQAAMRQVLVYESSALEIASGALPEVNLLDMIVFLALSRDALERYWNPRVFGARGAALAAAFAESERDLSPIAGRLLTAKQRADLDALVRAWQDAHPDQVRVENVRFLEFAAVAGRVSAEQASRARGLLAQVKSATQAADAALLLGERAMFLAHHMPFLVRAQARVGAQEVLSDVLHRTDDLVAALDRIPEARRLVQDVTLLTSTARGATREARLLLEDAAPLVEQVAGREEGHAAAEDADEASLQQTLMTAERLTSSAVTLLREVRELKPKDAARSLDALEQRADGIARRWLGYLIILGAAWTILFWGGYVVAKRLSAPARG